MITSVTCTQNRLDRISNNLPKILPWVDQAIVVDGGSSDGTAEYLKSLDKVHYIYRKWDDNFANQFNAFLKPIKSGWILFADDDEQPSIEMLKSLRGLIEESNDGKKFCCVEFRCNPINPEIGWNPGPVNYWRENFFKWTPEMRYEIDLHAALRGYKNDRFIRRSEVYYHIKTKRDELYADCCYYFIDGIWPTGAIKGIRDPSWHELRSILLEEYPSVNIFADLNNLLLSGNLKPKLLNWIKQSNKDPDPLYKQRSSYYTYYKSLHPEAL